MLEEALEKLKETEEHYKFIYIVPDFQNPAGVTLSLERRKKIIEFSEKYDVIIIEDTPYRQIRFEGEALPSLMSLDNTGNIISLHTFSKIFVPGLRLGWVVGHPDIIRKLAIIKQSVDLCTPTFTQLIAYEYCRRGLLEKHIKKVTDIYHKKRDVMLKALEKYMPQVKGLKWTRPQGGLFLWLMLPEHINTDKLFYEALKYNVAFVIGSAFYCDGKGQNTMRLNFSFPTEEEIDEGIKRLASAIKAKL